MISFLRGKVVLVGAYALVLDVGGVGYEIYMSSKALASLPPAGEECLVLVSMHIKDDKITLFGFKDELEKTVYTNLTSVSGIGPKLALAALSTYTASQVAQFVSDGDVAAICKVSGIGKKTAQRIVLELKGVLHKDADQSAAMPEQQKAFADARAALLSMGFGDDEVSAALGCVDKSAEDVSAIVRSALKNVGGGR